MPKINYYLSNKPNKDGECSILLFVSFSNQRITFSTKMNIHPKKWNPKDQVVRSSYTGAFSINKRLKDIKNEVEELFLTKFTMESPKPEEVKVSIQKVITPEKVNPGNEFYDFVENFIQTVIRKPNTLKKYKTTVSFLKEYEKTRNLPQPLNFNSFNLDWYNDFYSFLEKDKGQSLNTIGSYFKEVKVFLNEAHERDLHDNLFYKSKKFKVVEEDSDSIFLNENELRAMYSLDLSATPRLEHVRDLFIIGAWTGLRFSDLKNITRDKISGNKIKLRTVKTNEFVSVPIHATVLEILEKYAWELPRTISNQKFNEYIKEVAEMAGIVDEVSINLTKGGINEPIVYKKSELVTAHTSRRSFATNLYLKGYDTLMIRAITGHKTESSFMKYIKVTNDQYADKMAIEFQKEKKAV